MLKLITALIVFYSSFVFAGNIYEPKTSVNDGVAITVDLCGGKFDSSLFKTVS